MLHGINYILTSKTNQLKLPISEEYQEKRLLELDCHPLVGAEQVIEAAIY